MALISAADRLRAHIEERRPPIGDAPPPLPGTEWRPTGDGGWNLWDRLANDGPAKRWKYFDRLTEAEWEAIKNPNVAEVGSDDLDSRSGGDVVSMGADGRQTTELATSGDGDVATSGGAGEDKKNTVVAISGYKSRSRINAEDMSDSEITPSKLGIFPTTIGGSLFGIAKSGPVWRKPRRKTKPGNPRVAADGYEWRQTPSGNGWVLWHRPYLYNGKRGKAKYVAVYAPDSVRQLEKLYGKREISKSKRAAGPRGVASRRGADSDAGQQNANFG